MNYPEHLEVLKSHDFELGKIVSGWRNLDDILKRHGEANATLAGCDIVQQDEYNYDFLLPLNDSRWLSFAIS
jgi:hypothetical protein